VKFHVNKKGKGMWMEIKKGECGCGDFTQMPTKTYKCMEITRAKILPDADIGTSTVEFKVANSWFMSNGVARNGVALFRYTTTWEELSTSLGIDDGTYTHYTADTPGFSMFAIGVKPSAVTTQEEPVPEAVAPTEVVQEVQPDLGALAGQATETSGRSTKRTMWPWLALLGIIAIVVIIISTSKHKK
jgi:PGF-pre-PGF domain-containing protein